MKEISPELRKEVETWFEFVAGIDANYDSEERRRQAVEARAFHVLGTFEREDYDHVSETLLDADGSGSFAFLGRDAHEQAEIIETLDDAGHEIVLHGNRHISWAEFEYERAYEYLSRGYDAISEATGIEPEGFFAPLKTVDEGTLRAADELGIEWILGQTDADVPDSLNLVDTVYPHDNRLLEGDTSPEEAFDQLDEATDGKTFLFHPNMLMYHDAMAEFDGWIEDVSPVSIDRQLDEGGVGLVLDCVRPFKVI